MTNVQKAVRAVITLGDIELDVFQKPDGSYHHSQTQAFISIADDGYDTKQAAKRYIEICTAKKVQHLATPTILCIEKTKIEGENQIVKLISQTDIVTFWTMAAMLGYSKAFNLVAACAVESLERRADVAFGILRTEEERNQRMAARTKGKVARRSLTDVIQNYIKSHELSDNYKRFIFSNCSDHLNKIILGAKAKQAREFYQIPESSLLRNHIPVAAIRELELAEEMSARLIEERDMEPLEAVKQACVVCFTKSVGLD